MPSQPIAIVGHAIVSADGHIADAEGNMPAGLGNAADWRRFQAALDGSALVVLGRLGHERHPNPGRRRLVVTGRVDALVEADAETALWNPAGLGFDAALARLGIASGTIAITGGTRVFDLFLPRYDRFELAVSTRFTVPDGRPCFTAGHPDEVLVAAGLTPGAPEVLDADAGVVLVRWERGRGSE